MSDDFAAINSIAADEEWRVEAGACPVECRRHLHVAFAVGALVFFALHACTVPAVYGVLVGRSSIRGTALAAIGLVIGE